MIKQNTFINMGMSKIKKQRLPPKASPHNTPLIMQTARRYTNVMIKVRLLGI